MTFYASFTEDYEAIFPVSAAALTFLRHYLPETGTCLDVGCGPGHYCARLSETGRALVGIDLDAAMIAHAQQQYPHIEFRQMDMLNLASLGRSFDAIFCIGNVAAHLPPARVMEFLRLVRQMLIPGGVWIVQVMNWDYILRQSAYTFPQKTAAHRDLVFTREYAQISARQVSFKTELRAGAQTVFADTVLLYPVEAAHYLSWHADLGFEVLAHCADYDGSPFVAGQDSANLMVFRAPTSHVRESD